MGENDYCFNSESTSTLGQGQHYIAELPLGSDATGLPPRTASQEKRGGRSGKQGKFTVKPKAPRECDRHFHKEWEILRFRPSEITVRPGSIIATSAIQTCTF